MDELEQELFECIYCNCLSFEDNKESKVESYWNPEGLILYTCYYLLDEKYVKSSEVYEDIGAFSSRLIEIGFNLRYELNNNALRISIIRNNL